MSISPYIRKYFFCLLIGLLFLTLNAQDNLTKEFLSLPKNNDTLIAQIVKSAVNDSSKLEALLFDGITIDSTLLSTKINLGKGFYRSGQYERSVPYFKESITLSQKLNNKQTLKNAYFYLGNIHLSLWENEEALMAYYNALEVDLEKNSKDYKVIIQPSIAIILRRMRQSEQALKVCQNALSVISETRHYQNQNHINLITITCDVLIDLGEWDQLRTLTTQGLRMSQDIGYTDGLIDIYTKLGALAIEENKYKEAEEHLSKANSLLDASDTQSDLFRKNIRYFTALKEYKTGNFQATIKSLSTLIRSYDIERPQNELRFIESSRLLAASYKEIGNQEKSIYCYEMYTTLNEEYQLKKSSLVSSIYEKETSILDEQIESLETTQTFVNNRYKWLIFSILCITLLLFIVFLNRIKRRQSHSSGHLKKLTEKIEDLEIRREQSKNLKRKKLTKEVVIDATTTKQILKGLERLESQEYYLKIDCNLRSMAHKIKTNATYLSYTINLHRKKSFNEYINDLRINYALKRMQEDKKFRSFSINSIARELGYKSDYSFSKHFKSKTGHNPSDYIKQIKES